MEHIASLILTYIAILAVFVAIIMLIRLDRKVKRIQKCMNNHPAGKQLKTEPLPTGQTSGTTYIAAPMGEAMRRAHHLEGD